MRLIIIESPFAGDVERNRQYAQKCLLDAIKRGEAPFASHLLYTQVLDDTNLEERRKGINMQHAWRAQANATVVYEDYGISFGMALGIEDAKKINQFVEYRKILPLGNVVQIGG